MQTSRLAAVLAAPLLLVSACGSGSTSSDGPGSGAGPGSTSGGPAEVQLRSGPEGSYLADADGRALYLLTADTGSTSTCTGPCATNWPPLTTTGKPKAAGEVEADDLGTTKRSDGSTQVTYYGHPLYYFAKDTGPGTTAGQGIESFGGYWWLVDSSGKAISTGEDDDSSSSDDTGGY